MNILLWSALIFLSSMIQVLVGTVRLILMVKNKKVLSVIIGFFEALIYLSIITTVISQMVNAGTNIYLILSYSAGFALGLYIGMLISQLISKDIVSVNIISKVLSGDIEDVLREKGFGVTSYTGSGKDGKLKVLYVICKKSNLNKLKTLVKKIDPKVLVSSHSLEGLSGGFVYGLKSRP